MWWYPRIFFTAVSYITSHCIYPLLALPLKGRIQSLYILNANVVLRTAWGAALRSKRVPEYG